MKTKISIIIPNRNGEKSIGLCLESLFKQPDDWYEVIVVDDCSTDGSLAVIEQYPCKLIRLKGHLGASGARNRGAAAATGETLFFIDSDCIVIKNCLSMVQRAAQQYGPRTIIGGTYTCRPHDSDFFSRFQSLFIHFSETKNVRNPDYIATHAMVINRETFSKSGGFSEDFLPILEDVEFSHRLKKLGYQLIMEPQLLVRHIFCFSLVRSLQNGFRKSKYWTTYSLGNNDLFHDSGTASIELKTTVLTAHILLFLAVVCLGYPSFFSPLLFLIPTLVNLIISYRLIRLFFTTSSLHFSIGATLYYLFVYPFAVSLGAVAGIQLHLKAWWKKMNLFPLLRVRR